MKKINLKGVNAQSVTGVVLLIVALINAVLQMFGYNTLPITNEDVYSYIIYFCNSGCSLYYI